MPRTCLATIVILAILVAPAISAVIHVDVAGGGDYLTISEGVAAASSGDTLLVAPGTYTGPLNRGILSDYLTIMSEAGPEATIIDCEYEGIAFRANHSSLRGFTIRNGDYPQSRAGGVVDIRHTDVSECCIENSACTGMEISGECTVTDCVFRNGEDFAVEMISYQGGSLTGCLLEDNAKGIRIWDVWNSSSDAPSRRFFTVSDCVLTGNGDPSVWIDCTGPLFEDCLFSGNHGTIFEVRTAYYAHIRRCTIVDNDTEGSYIFEFHTGYEFPNDCTIANNIIAFNECSSLVGGPYQNSTFLRNCYLNPDASTDALPGGGEAPFENVHTDPLLCGLDAGYYALCANSPCLTENEPIGVSMGADHDAAGCDPCSSPVEHASWGAIKALFGPEDQR